MSDSTTYKQQAGEAAAAQVTSGMIVGLGHGSTAIWATRAIAAKLKSGELANVLGVPCSLAVEAEATELGIPLTTLNQHPVVDLTIDGADEVDPCLNLIKGGGGALLREKVVAQASKREIIVVDDSKVTEALCTRFALPVEVLPIATATEKRLLEHLGATVSLRTTADGQAFVTDQGNLILDAAFPPHPPETLPLLAARLDVRAGIMAHGLFMGLADEVIIAGKDGLSTMSRCGCGHEH